MQYNVNVYFHLFRCASLRAAPILCSQSRLRMTSASESLTGKNRRDASSPMVLHPANHVAAHVQNIYRCERLETHLLYPDRMYSLSFCHSGISIQVSVLRNSLAVPVKPEASPALLGSRGPFFRSRARPDIIQSRKRFLQQAGGFDCRQMKVNREKYFGARPRGRAHHVV